uniref:HtyD n=1 Tax=Phialomyces arenicola TaxID=168477 RepID=A0A6H0XBB6_9EURO|nr:HtyD [Phialomyces arenicola]
MSKPSIAYCFDDNLPGEVVEFVRALFKILADTRGILLQDLSISDLPLDSRSSPSILHLAQPKGPNDGTSTINNLQDFIGRLCNELEAVGRQAEASTLLYVWDLCQTEKEWGGLGFIDELSGWQLKPKLLNDLEFLIEAWLEALNSAESSRSLPAPLPVKAINTWPMTLAEKILAHHAFSLPSSHGLKVGELVRVSVDWIIASELSWVGMKHSMNSIGEQPSIWRNDRFWLAGDHTVDPRTYDQPRVRELIDGMHDAKKQFKMTENQGSNYTILHTEFVRERAEPGMLVLGSDSHTCSAGAVSSLAIGLGAADVMAALATGETWIKVPESIQVEFSGEPAWYIRGKDVILYVLKELKRNTYAADRIVEFGGPGARHLSCDARFAISNMCTELGAISGIFVPDEITARFISDRPRSRYKSNSLYFKPDSDASYAATFHINLGEVESFLALYPSPDNVVPVTEKLGMTFEGCFIGACTTTEEDLILAALVLEAGLRNGLSSAPGKRMVVPGSLPIVKNLQALGLLDIYTQAGFEQPAPSCSLCLGMGADRAGEGENWLSSQNRNFKNRMGKGSIGHICSAATVAASSFSMTLTDPRSLLSQVSVERYQMLLENCRRSKTKGLNLRHRKINSVQNSVPGSMPSYVEPYLSLRTAPALSNLQSGAERGIEQKTSGSVDVIKSKVYALGDFVDTDAIIPASFILESPTDSLLGSHCLEFTNPDFRDKVREGMDVVVAGKAFGCGSSREEAPRALKGLGVKCVIAKSFSFIYGRNQPTIGLLGINISDDSFYDAAQTGTGIEIDLPGRLVKVGGQSFAFILDDMELSLIKSRGLAAAYKKFGKDVFQSLCDDDHRTNMVYELADVKLRAHGPETRAELAW